MELDPTRWTGNFVSKAQPKILKMSQLLITCQVSEVAKEIKVSGKWVTKAR